MRSECNHKVFSISATFFTASPVRLTKDLQNSEQVNTLLHSHRRIINHEGYKKLNIIRFWAYCTPTKKMFSLNVAFKTMGLLHVKIHPILMLFILIVKFHACLHVVYLTLKTTPCHRMDTPAPQHLGCKNRCCHSTASSVNGQLLQWCRQMGALISLDLT